METRWRSERESGQSVVLPLFLCLLRRLDSARRVVQGRLEVWGRGRSDERILLSGTSEMEAPAGRRLPSRSGEAAVRLRAPVPLEESGRALRRRSTRSCGIDVSVSKR